MFSYKSIGKPRQDTNQQLSNSDWLESWNFEYNSNRRWGHFSTLTMNKLGADQTVQISKLIFAFES